MNSWDRYIAGCSDKPVLEPGFGDALIAFDGLKRHGVDYTRERLIQLMWARRFPEPIRIVTGHPVWRLSDVLKWKASRKPETAVGRRHV